MRIVHQPVKDAIGIAGYTPSAKSFDALIVGYYEGDQLVYVARTRNGFTPALRTQLFKRFRGLETAECPFANIPEARSGRWGEGLTAEKMKDCRWLKPVPVGQVEFVEWTPDNHLRHSSFIALREDRDAREVRREDASRRKQRKGPQKWGCFRSSLYRR